MSSAPEVAAFCALTSIVVVAATSRREGDPVPWRRVSKIGTAYRETDHDTTIAVPSSIQRARAVAWIVVVLGVLHVLATLGMILLQGGTESVGHGDGGYISPDSDTGPMLTLQVFDSSAAALYGLAMILSAGVVGAFARWASDAAKNLTQARGTMPIATACVLAVATVFIEVAFAFHHETFPGRGHLYPWPMALSYVTVVLFGAALVAIGRRDALRVSSS